jgi:hypothetical protein
MNCHAWVKKKLINFDRKGRRYYPDWTIYTPIENLFSRYMLFLSLFFVIIYCQKYPKIVRNFLDGLFFKSIFTIGKTIISQFFLRY